MKPEVREQPQRSPNARLQDDILLYLEAEHTVHSVAELGRRLDAPRPSVSRAINLLASGGFVSKEGREWTLTDAGREDALQLRDRRSDQLGRYALHPQIEALERKNAELQAELWKQWWMNHSEHCRIDWPHSQPHLCAWPFPDALRVMFPTTALPDHLRAQETRCNCGACEQDDHV